MAEQSADQSPHQIRVFSHGELLLPGVGVPQITAVADAVEALEGTGIPVIADGG
ncbi:IMP dehydrogenase, partial [Escherichia sp. HC-CC]